MTGIPIERTEDEDECNSIFGLMISILIGCYPNSNSKICILTWSVSTKVLKTNLIGLWKKNKPCCNTQLPIQISTRLLSVFQLDSLTSGISIFKCYAKIVEECLAGFGLRCAPKYSSCSFEPWFDAGPERHKLLMQQPLLPLRPSRALGAPAQRTFPAPSDGSERAGAAPRPSWACSPCTPSATLRCIAGAWKWCWCGRWQSQNAAASLLISERELVW